jgi:type III pantothenate kinase
VKPHKHPGHRENIWLALEIGNSRLHWALFTGETLECVWDTDYLPEFVIQQMAQCRTLDDLPTEIFPLSKQSGRQREIIAETSSYLPIFVASVVPKQTALWQNYPHIRVITLDQVPLKGMYPTLGIDRALALWGAGKTWGFPMLVIDAGTALTFTGQLPQLETQVITSLPPRFALNTPEAIQSGVIYTLVAGIKDFIEAWWHLFPEGKIAIKGGDRTLLINYLQAQFPKIAAHLIVEQNLSFWGMQKMVL